MEPEDQLLDLQQVQRQIQAEYPIDLLPFNAPTLVKQPDRHPVWQAEQSEKIQAALRTVYGDTPPPGVWEKVEEIAA